MKKKQTWMGITKGLLLGAALSVSLLFTNDVYADDEPAKTTTVVTYEAERVIVEEEVEGAEGTAKTGYYFVTTTAPKTTKIPATNKWERTINGAVDVSAYPNGKTLYFANSTSPAYEEIVTVVVPAQPKFKSIGYAPAAKADSTMELLKNPKVTVKDKDGKAKTIDLKDEDVSKIEYRKKDTENFTNGEQEVTGESENTKVQTFPAVLPTAQKSGATLEFRTTSDEKEEAVKNEEDGIYYFSNADVVPSVKKEDCIAGAFLRPGVIKTVKVTKMAAAPAVTIDFANHSFKVKKGQEYAKADTTFTLTGEYKEVTDSKGEVVYFNDNEVYMVRTTATSKKAASLPVFITTGVTKTFAEAYGTDNKVTVKGGSTDTAHVMTISRKVIESNASEAKKLNPAQSYQYAIVDSVDAYINGDGTLNYSKLVTDKVAWKSATIKAGQASVNVTLKDTKTVKIVGKQIILRAAKGTNILSSKAVILTAPTAATAEAEAVDYWTQRAAGDEESMACLNINSEVGYKATTQELMIKAGGAASVEENAKVNITVSTGTGKKKVEKTIESPVIVDEMGNATIVTSIKELGAAASDKLKLTVVVPAGTLTGIDGAGNAEQKLSVTVDTKAPVISVKTAAKDKVTFTVDSTVKIDYVASTEDGSEEKTITLDADKELAKEDCAQFIEIYKGDSETKETVDVKATYNKKAKTLVVEYAMDPKSSADYKVVLKGVTDLAGNAVAAKENDTSATVKDGDITFTVANKAYVAVNTVAFKKSEYTIEQGATLDLKDEFTINPTTATNTAATWDISHNNLGAAAITISDGVVTLTEGAQADVSETVTLTVDGKTATCTVKTVAKAAEPETTE